MELLPIGDAADRLGLATSTLRYYDERGLGPACTREGGTRMYGQDELRRLAFLKIVRRLGIPLETAASVLDTASPHWRAAVREQMTELDRLIDQARGARTFLGHALDCPEARPARDCASMTAALDHLVAGGSMDDLRDQYARTAAGAD